MDVEKARELLSRIGSKAAIGADPAWTEHQIVAALRALDGDGAEEWTARPDGYGLWAIDGPCATVIARDVVEANAHRIARLPALERAAGAVIRRWHASVDSQELDALAEALKQES